MTSFKNQIWTERPVKYSSNRLNLSDGGVSAQEQDLFEQRLVRNLVGRTGLVFRLKEFRLPEGLTGKKTDDKITITCVSSELIVGSNDTSHLAYHSCRDDCSLLRSTGHITTGQWIELRETELKAALEHKPDILCFGELTYPPPISELDTGTTVHGLRSYGMIRERYEERMLNALSEKNLECFTFLGSYHCLVSLYNVGIVYPLGYHRNPITVTATQEPATGGEGEETKDELVEPPVIYLKRFPARRRGENTRVPAGSEFQIFHTKVGRVAILICSDIVDLNQFLYIAKNNIADRYNPIDIILVPSFNRSERLRSMCRELSYLANTVVVCVNANPYISDYPDTEIYACGFDSEEIGDKYILKEAFDVQISDLGYKSKIFNFEIKDSDLRHLRDAVLKSHFFKTDDVVGNLDVGRI